MVVHAVAWFALEVADRWIRVEDKIISGRLLIFALAFAGIAVPNFFFTLEVTVRLTVNWRAVADTCVKIEVEAWCAVSLLQLAAARGSVPEIFVCLGRAIDFHSGVSAILSVADALAVLIVPRVVRWTFLFEAVAFAIVDIKIFSNGAGLLGKAALVRLLVPRFPTIALLRLRGEFAQLVVPEITVKASVFRSLASALTVCRVVVSCIFDAVNCDSTALLRSTFTSTGVIVPVV